MQGYTSTVEALDTLLNSSGAAVLAGRRTMEYEVFRRQLYGATYMSRCLAGPKRKSPKRETVEPSPSPREAFVRDPHYTSWMFGRGFPLASNISAFLSRCLETGLYAKVGMASSLS